ncbi:MAG TPA: DsbA family protein [Aliidiomarina sp.]|nr:DsbA family protein [Aliidiomarina sp.]
MKKWLLGLVLAVATAGLAVSVSQQAKAQTASHSELNKQVEEINQILHQNPDIVPELLNSLKGFLDSKKQSEQAMQNYQQWLFNNDKVHPWVGASNPELTIVVFTDYDCPYCKRLDPHLQKLKDNFPQVKIVSVFVPLRQQELSGSSVNPSEYGMNVWHDNASKYAEAESLLYRKNGMHDATSLRQIAQRTETAGLLTANREVKEAIATNYRAFTELGLRGTPAIMIGEGVIPGYVEYEQLAEVVRSQL